MQALSDFDVMKFMKSNALEKCDMADPNKKGAVLWQLTQENQCL